MNVLVEIESAEVAVKQGQSSKTGKDYCIRTQEGYLKLPHFKYPQAIKFMLEDQAAPYAVGTYMLDTESFWINEFKELKLGRVRLKPFVGNTAARPSPVAQAVASQRA